MMEALSIHSGISEGELEGVEDLPTLSLDASENIADALGVTPREQLSAISSSDRGADIDPSDQQEPGIY